MRVVDGQRWSGRDEQGTPFLQLPLTPGGPTVEVLLVRGPVMRVVFQGRHAVVDGRGLLHFAEDVFAVLRGESPRGASLDVVDLELATLGGKGRGREKPEWSMPTGMPRPVPRGTHALATGSVRRLHPALSAPAGTGRAPRLACLYAGAPSDRGPGRPSTPPSRRGHTTANITGGARIDMPAVVDAPDLIDAFVTMLKEGAAHPDAAAPIVDTQLFRWLPTRTSVRLLRKVRAKSLETDGLASAILSNLGRYPLKRLSCPRHTTSSWFWVPSGGPVVPLFILVTGDGQGVELSVEMSPELATDGRLDGLVDGILHHLNCSGEDPGWALFPHRFVPQRRRACLAVNGILAPSARSRCADGRGPAGCPQRTGPRRCLSGGCVGISRGARPVVPLTRAAARAPHCGAVCRAAAAASISSAAHSAACLEDAPPRALWCRCNRR